MARAPEGRRLLPDAACTRRAPLSKRMIRRLRGFGRDRRAVTAIEYALIGAFLFLVIIVAVTSVGTKLLAPFRDVSAAFS